MNIICHQPRQEIQVELTRKENEMLLLRFPNSPPENHQLGQRLYAGILLFQQDHGNLPIKVVITD